MQLFVIGMHRSGTSAVARLLNLMGCHLGPEEQLIPPKPDNPKGFWERRDVCRLNSDVLSALGGGWDTLPERGIEDLAGPEHRELTARARRIVEELDAHRPWVVKDPRLCVTFPLWKQVSECPLAVLVHRRPLQVAESLAARDGFSLVVGVALWERYTRAALEVTRDVPRVLVAHSNLMRDPAGTANRLWEELERAGVQGLAHPQSSEVEAFVSRKLFRARGGAEAEREFLNPARAELLEGLEGGFSATCAASGELSADAQGVLREHCRAIEAEARRVELERERDELYAGHTALVREHDRVAAERDAFFVQHGQVAAERDRLYSKHQELVGEHDRVAAERDAMYLERNQLAAERDSLYLERNQLAAERDTLYLKGNQLAAERDQLWTEKVEAEQERDSFGHSLRRLEVEHEGLEHRLAALAASHDQVLSSRSYRLGRLLTGPLRALRRLLRRPTGGTSR